MSRHAVQVHNLISSKCFHFQTSSREGIFFLLPFPHQVGPRLLQEACGAEGWGEKTTPRKKNTGERMVWGRVGAGPANLVLVHLLRGSWKQEISGNSLKQNCISLTPVGVGFLAPDLSLGFTKPTSRSMPSFPA